ncbi:MAG: sirohydrochlorin cobaltochelatase [Tissierellia bacterium]|nr:sirohydrochlorin cobaltochelatase [Tissierellia bacterium]MDD4726307.1 sirohydrochlorin cobaltochelatase [Tissierellia bacterium]
MEKGIIVTSFGTTYEETRKLCIESIENRITEEFSDCVVSRAFTSRMVINKLKKRDNYFVDTPTEALERMKDKGVNNIYIQPLLIIEGLEYEKILREARDFIKENNKYSVTVGRPLLSSDLDYEKVVDALALDNRNEAIVFMGHGSTHEMDISYERLERITHEKGYDNIFFATVEGKRTIDDVVEALITKKINKVLLTPFMLVAGDHATNDMASSDEDSWKNIVERNGVEVTLKIEGLGQRKLIQDIFIDHLKDTLAD